MSNFIKKSGATAGTILVAAAEDIFGMHTANSAAIVVGLLSAAALATMKGLARNDVESRA